MKKTWDETTDMGRLLIAAKAKFPHIRRFADVARHLDLFEAVLTNWKKRGIPAGRIFELSDTFSCNPKWLATGDGDMRAADYHQYGIRFDEVTMEKIEYFKEKIIPMSNEEFLARKRLSEQADRVAEITKGKGSGKGNESK